MKPKRALRPSMQTSKHVKSSEASIPTKGITNNNNRISDARTAWVQSVCPFQPMKFCCASNNRTFTLSVPEFSNCNKAHARNKKQQKTTKNNKNEFAIQYGYPATHVTE